MQTKAYIKEYCSSSITDLKLTNSVDSYFCNFFTEVLSNEFQDPGKKVPGFSHQVDLAGFISGFGNWS
jgi:hypothetical protein